MNDVILPPAPPTPAAVPAAGHAPDPSTGELFRQLRELEARYAPPTVSDVLADWAWVRELMTGATLAEDWPYWDQNIAVYQKQIVGGGRDGLQLRLDTARSLGIHPERVVVTFVGEF